MSLNSGALRSAAATSARYCARLGKQLEHQPILSVQSGKRIH